MFPVSDNSQTIIDCLLEEAKRLGVKIQTQVLVKSVERTGTAKESGFAIHLDNGEKILADRLILATGSNPQGWAWSRALGHSLETPVPSLFTLTIKDPRLEGFAGLSVPQARVSLEGTKLSQEGALLITHWGFSGPAALKLSAWGARRCHDLNLSDEPPLQLPAGKSARKTLVTPSRTPHAIKSKKKAPGDFSFGLPRRLWFRLSAVSGILANKRWTEISQDNLKALAQELQNGIYPISGKSTFKEEFVTCGGVRLSEVDFRTMESKLCPGLYFAGEVLDIDGVTGGFNFQSAWTTGFEKKKKKKKKKPYIPDGRSQVLDPLAWQTPRIHHIRSRFIKHPLLFRR